MKERELEAGVMRFVREIGIAPEGKVRTVGFDLTGAGPVTGAGIALDIPKTATRLRCARSDFQARRLGRAAAALGVR